MTGNEWDRSDNIMVMLTDSTDSTRSTILHSSPFRYLGDISFLDPIFVMVSCAIIVVGLIGCTRHLLYFFILTMCIPRIPNGSNAL
jgi:hypothetical protein